MAQMPTKEDRLNARIGTMEGWLATTDSQLDEARFQLRELKAEVAKLADAKTEIPPEPGWWEEWHSRTGFVPWKDLSPQTREHYAGMEQTILDYAMRHGDGLERAEVELTKRIRQESPPPCITALLRARDALVVYLSELRTE